MLTIGPVSFLAPLALLALALLPAIWWLLRATPPTPLRLRFPPVRLLLRLVAREDSVQRTPPWLLVLRLTLAALVIVAAARPLLDAARPLPGSGPVVLIVDTGWGAAANWDAVQTTLSDLLDRAGREDRAVILAPTAPVEAAPADRGGDGETAGDGPWLMTAEAARPAAAALEPKPWTPERSETVAALMAMPALVDEPPGAIFWLSDGLEYSEGEAGSLASLTDRLRPFGSVAVITPEPAQTALVMGSPERQGTALTVAIERLPGAEQTVWLRAVDDDGGVLAREPVAFAAGDGRAAAVLTLPPELAQRINRLRLEEASGAAAVMLLDDRWRRRSVGIVTGSGSGVGDDLPLLGPAYYLERAFEPFAAVRHGDLDTLLERELPMIVLLGGGVTNEAEQRLVTWVEQGGVLLRFASARLTGFRSGAPEDDPLLPVRLRPGDRTLGGALAWREPARLAPFAGDGPFAGLAVPDDVEVRRQVLAEPTLDLDALTLARLDDGTPLITAARRGTGQVVLVHTTADPSWSSLPLSGLFVDILERIAGLGRAGTTPQDGAPLRPLEILDGHGRSGPPPAAARPIEPAAFADVVPGPRHPPGFYGRGDERRALNLGSSVGPPRPVGSLPPGVERAGYARAGEVPLAPWLLAAALALLIVDLAVSLAMRGVLRRSAWRRGLAAGSVALLCLSEAQAQEVIADGSAIPDALETRLAWVITGDPDVDAVSAAGLAGLSAMVVRRTAVELGRPVGVDPGRDNLAFYPLLYWPIVPGTPPPSGNAADALQSYLESGGTILFDTRDRGAGPRPAGSLRPFARALDLPPLTAIPRDHVLGRSYYLLSVFPGRWTGGRVWVERQVSALHDGVSSVVAGDHDWAGAWALDARRRPMFAVVPGGERQREMAYRFGINLVMHVLTGNYKADQVHLPAILERLKQ